MLFVVCKEVPAHKASRKTVGKKGDSQCAVKASSPAKSEPTLVIGVFKGQDDDAQVPGAGNPHLSVWDFSVCSYIAYCNPLICVHDIEGRWRLSGD